MFVKLIELILSAGAALFAAGFGIVLACYLFAAGIRLAARILRSLAG